MSLTQQEIAYLLECTSTEARGLPSTTALQAKLKAMADGSEASELAQARAAIDELVRFNKALLLLIPEPNRPPHVSHAAGGEAVAVSTDIYWRYDKAPRGADIFLLTEGNVAVRGQWRDGAGFKAWHPLFKRDKTKEKTQ